MVLIWCSVVSCLRWSLVVFVGLIVLVSCLGVSLGGVYALGVGSLYVSLLDIGCLRFPWGGFVVVLFSGF